MKKLNRLENEILWILTNEYPDLKDHIKYLEVVDRELTGVGMFTKLNYRKLGLGFKLIKDEILSTNKIISLDSLENGLGFTVDVTNGLVNFIELFTYDDETWDGSFNKFEFTNIF